MERSMKEMAKDSPSLPIPQSLVAIIGLSLLFLVLYFDYTRRGKQLRLPPGPAPLPLIGNIHQLPRGKDQWKAYSQWHKTYGPIFSFRCGQRLFISIGSRQVAEDLLKRRGSIYNSRPRLVVVGDHFTKGLHSVLIPYNDRWRAHNRILLSLFSSRPTAKCRPVQDLESKQLLYDLLHAPLDGPSTGVDFTLHFQRLTASLMSYLTYGKRLDSPAAPEIAEMHELTMNLVRSANRLETQLAEIFPVLSNLPAWLAPWKRKGDEIHAKAVAMFDQYVTIGKQHGQWNWTNQAQSMAQDPRIRNLHDMSDTELAYLLGGLQEVGTETTTGLLRLFVLACILHPTQMKTAQEEIDHVAGEQLPSFDHLPHLPYIHAFMQEVLRWRPLLPLGIPHATTQNDEYMGYQIPKDATILLSHWALQLGEEVYEDPHEFNPHRWLDNPNLPSYAFGLGRRACPGRWLAQDTFFIVATRLLWAYDITLAKKDGQEVEVDSWAMEQGIASPPSPFPASLCVRSQWHREAIESVWASTERDLDILMGSS